MNPHRHNIGRSGDYSSSSSDINESDYRLHSGRQSQTSQTGQTGQTGQLFADYSNVNPYHARILRYFECDHLPEYLRGTSKMFQAMAWALAYKKDTDPSEMTISLRKLLESKDAAVRACLSQQNHGDSDNQDQRQDADENNEPDDDSEDSESGEREVRGR